MRSSEGIYYPRLDHIRGVAAFCVFAWHALHTTIPFCYVPPFPPLSLLEEGFTGVSLFMTLSGYLFMRLVLGKNIIYSNFLWNRLIRLGPLLFVAFLLASAQNNFNFYQFIRGFIWPNWPYGAWSVTTELHFYLIFPIAVAAVQRHGIRIIVAMLICTTGLRLAIWLYKGEVQSFAYWTLIGRIDQFLLGMTFCLLRTRFPNFFGNATLAMSAVGFIAIWHAFNSKGGFACAPSYPSPSFTWVLLPSIEGVSYGLFIASYELSEFGLEGATGRLAAKVGEASYSIYIWHVPLLHFIFHQIGVFDSIETSILFLFAGFPVVALVGYASYLSIEKPLLVFRMRYLR